MKKFTLLVFIALAACSAPQYMLQTVTTDFSAYTRQGFTFSTTTINQAFTPVGMVEAVCFEGVVAGERTKDLRDPLYITPQRGNIALCTTPDLVDALYQEATRLNANGVINLEFSTQLINGREAFVARGEAVRIR